MKKLLTLCVIFASFTTFISCEKEDLTIKSITLDLPKLTLKVYETHQFVVSTNPANLNPPVYTWTSSNKDVLTVNDKGEVNAISLGDATITVNNVDKSLQASCDVTVEPIKATGFSFDLKNIELIINEEVVLTYKITPENLTNKQVTWSSADTKIATVDNTGRVKAIGVGETKITAKTDNLFSDVCNIKVNPITAKGISLDLKNIDLLVEEETVLTCKITPENTTNKQVTWSSADTKIATVDNTGRVKAIGVGETKIKAETDNLISDICNVKVNPIKAKSISLNQKSISIEISDKQTVNVNFTPENTTNKKINWSSSNSNVALVSETGEITGIGEGTAVITAKSEDGGFTANCDVLVNIKGLALTSSSISLPLGESQLIWVKYSTSNNAYIHATWRSSNQSVATVTGDGDGTNSAIIEAKGVGTTVITATSADGTKIASCYIYVDEMINFLFFQSNPQSASFTSNGTSYGVWCKITNPTNYYIYIDAVILLNEFNEMLQVGSLQGSANLGKGSVIATFNPVAFKEGYPSSGEKLSKYKVLIQISYKGKIYQKLVNVNSGPIGGFY